MYGDQFHNAAAAKSRGMGFIVHYEDITEKSIKNAINNALEQQAADNANKVSFSFKNREKNLTKTAVWWVEYVAATHGAPLLKSNSINLSALTYYSFDIYVTILAIVLIVNISWIYVTKYVLKKWFNQDKSKIE